MAAPWVLVLAVAVGEREAGTGGAGWLLKPEAGGGVLEGVARGAWEGWFSLGSVDLMVWRLSAPPVVFSFSSSSQSPPPVALLLLLLLPPGVVVPPTLPDAGTLRAEGVAQVHLETCMVVSG